MNGKDVSCRTIMLAGAGFAVADKAVPQGTGGALTAGQVIERIKKNIGIPWRAETSAT